MFIRKLVKAGQTSHTIALPKEWITKNSLKKGDLIYVRMHSENELIISTELKEKKAVLKEISISIDKKSIGTINRELTSAYINNYSTINIIGPDLYKISTDLRNVINNFVALEITEQTSSSIIAKDMLNIKEVSIDNNIRRMDNIVRSILKDYLNFEKEMLDSIKSRDSDVNRLYFLLFKIIKSALGNENISKDVGIKSKTDILPLWYLILNIESFADSIADIFILSMDLTSKSFFDGILKLINGIQSDFTNVMKAFYNSDKMLADNIASNRIQVLKSCDELSNNYEEIILTKIIEHIKELENLICNISRIVMDKD